MARILSENIYSNFNRASSVVTFNFFAVARDRSEERGDDLDVVVADAGVEDAPRDLALLLRRVAQEAHRCEVTV